MGIDVESLYGRRNDDRWNRMVVGDILERVSWSTPDKDAMVATPDAVADPRYARVTYAEADRIANRVARALLGLGLARGDRVAMLCENSVEAYLTKIGIAKAGLVAVPINTMMADDMVEHMLRHVEARVAVVDADRWVDRGAPFAAAGVVPVAALRGSAAPPPGAADFHEWIADVDDTEPDVRLHGDDIWEILPTSGTTAMPKAVMISHTYSYAAASSHALSYSRGLDVESDLRLCTYLPVVFHIGDHAFVLSVFLSGGTVLLGRRPSGAAVAATVTAERATCLWGGSPQFLGDVARAAAAEPERHDLSSLGVVVYGWAAMDPALSASLTALCGDELRFVAIFGQTEAIACHRWWPARRPDLHERTAPTTNYVGVPTPLLGSTIVDAEGRSLHDRPGEPGEAVYRSPAMTSGYYRDEAATREAFRDGWFHSGDMCAYGEDGLRIMVDRYKDVVKSGGENVSSIRVESVLAQHPAVARAAVVGIPDDRWGEAVVGVVMAADGAVVDEQDVIAFCRERLAGYETPKRIAVVDGLPETVGGKVLKYRLRARLAEGTA